MKKHTVNHCPQLLKYGHLVLSTEDRAELGREIHNPAFYVNKPKPAGEQKTVVNCTVPRSATCVVVQHRFILLRDIHINSPTIMHVKCTILDDAARPMEEYTDAIFTTDAIMSYVSSGRKKIVNQLQKAAATVHQTESISKCPHQVWTHLPVDTVVQPVTGGVVQAQTGVTNQCSYGKDCKMSHLSPQTCTKCDSNSVHRLCVPSETEQLWCLGCIVT